MDEAVLREWTGAQARALRVALRMTVRDFATRLGVAPRTVAQWEARGDTIRPRPELQATLDTALSRASEDERTRFRLLLGGEPSGEGDDPTNRRQLLQGGLSATALAVLDGA